MLNLLGKGGFACVYRARSNKTGQEVAIKMVSTRNSTPLHSLQNNEAQFLMNGEDYY